MFYNINLISIMCSNKRQRKGELDMKSTKNLVMGALMAALTCIATMIIKIPTPTLGYIHLGDGLVLLCGIVLGPLGGALSAGIGSMFADIF